MVNFIFGRISDGVEFGVNESPYSHALLVYESFLRMHLSPSERDLSEINKANLGETFLAGHIFGEGPWTSKRDAFQALEKAVGVNTIRQWMKEGMTAAGLPWVSHGGGMRA